MIDAPRSVDDLLRICQTNQSILFFNWLPLQGPTGQAKPEITIFDNVRRLISMYVEICPHHFVQEEIIEIVAIDKSECNACNADGCI